MTPDHLIWFRSLHYGATSVCLWWVILESGQLHVKAELVTEKYLISTLAHAIRHQTRVLRAPHIRYTVALAEQLVGKTQKGDDGETVADTFRANGLIVRPTSHDPIQGWTRVSELFGLRPDGRPWVTIDPRCEALQRAVTNAISDPADPQNVVESPTDQALRALRVGAMSRPAPRPLQPIPMPKNAVGHLLDACRAGADKSSLAWR